MTSFVQCRATAAPASIAGAPTIKQAAHRHHARRSAFDHEVDRCLAGKQKPAVFQSDPPIRQCFPKTDIESLEDADGKRDSRHDLLIEACAMGIGLQGKIGRYARPRLVGSKAASRL